MSSESASSEALSETTPSASKEREEIIREAAYLKAQERGFEPGHELDDWLAAEQEADETM